jgi:hypothetical protein
VRLTFYLNLASAKFSYNVSRLLAMGGIDEIHFDLYGYDLEEVDLIEG